MKHKSTLVLIEQTVLLLVFALSAVLCLRAFLWADGTSRELAARDQALLLAQNAAQVIRAEEGDLDRAAELMGGLARDGSWVILYDEDWSVTDDMHTYTLRAEVSDIPPVCLGSALVTVHGDTQLAQLEICWQEVIPHD